MKRALVVLAASLSTVLLSACGGNKSLPLSGASSQPGANAASPSPNLGIFKEFKYTGSPQSYTVPQRITRLEIWAYGGAGGGGAGGPGGTVHAWITVHPGQVLGIFVGGRGLVGGGCKGGPGGWNGGGPGGSPQNHCVRAFLGSGGGGASDVRDGGEHAGLEKRLLVAGGGGGEAAANVGWWDGGAGGFKGSGYDGRTGDSYHEKSKGRGGTQTAGGVAGTPYCDHPATSGTLGRGGTGGASCVAVTDQNYSGGGGGGGYYGGGGGSGNSFGSFSFPGDGGGGGGSCFVAAGATYIMLLPLHNHFHNDGYIQIANGH